MLAVRETTTGLQTVNLAKILFFYPVKSGNAARLEMEDGTIMDVLTPYDELNAKLAEVGLFVPL